MFIKQNSQSREKGGGGGSSVFVVLIKQMSIKATSMIENTYIIFHKDLSLKMEAMELYQILQYLSYIPSIILKSSKVSLPKHLPASTQNIQ